MTSIRVGDRIFFAYRNDYGGKTQASGLVLEIECPICPVSGDKGPQLFRVSCDTPDVWIGTLDPKSNTRIVSVREREVWRLK